MRETTRTKSTKDQIRELAESDLFAFIRLVHPQRALGLVHRDLISWWTRRDAKSHQLILLPRDHQKSALAAYRVAWEITKNPSIRVLYISSTSNLAIKQLKFIKDILTHDTYRYYWPEMVNPEETKREKWSETEIAVDHPQRKLDIVRDPTVFTAGLTANIVGLHCDLAVLDDVVVDDTAYNETGREKLRSQVSYLASIAGTDSRTWVVGTRYHPKDLYNDMLETYVDVFDEVGDIVGHDLLYEVYEKKVENVGDGTGEFIWPRSQHEGKWFGFNREILAKKKAQYHDQAKFRSQYYNDPNDASTANISKDWFQYYDRSFLKRDNGSWFYKGNKLNIFAAVDFAFSTKKEADSTAIVVIGIDKKHNIFILEIDRFKTTRISDYFDKILRLHVKWDFRKIRAETTVAQKVIVEDLKNNYIRPHGLALSIVDDRPTKKKEERIDAVLQPKYANRQIWHYPGGNCELLEEELSLQRPPHDDIKDALSAACEIAVPPSFMGMGNTAEEKTFSYHKRFGGIN